MFVRKRKKKYEKEFEWDHYFIVYDLGINNSLYILATPSCFK